MNEIKKIFKLLVGMFLFLEPFDNTDIDHLGLSIQYHITRINISLSLLLFKSRFSVAVYVNINQATCSLLRHITDAPQEKILTQVLCR